MGSTRAGRVQCQLLTHVVSKMEHSPKLTTVDRRLARRRYFPACCISTAGVHIDSTLFLVPVRQLMFSPPNRSRKTAATLLIFTQTYPPDPAAVGQHFADAASELARRGHCVVVFTAGSGYNDPKLRYPSREFAPDGVEVRRFPFSSLGKRNMFMRAVGAVNFMVQCFARALFTPKLKGMLVSTSPPLIGVVAALAGMIRGVPYGYWAMDLNPDQLIALGNIREKGLLAKTLEAFNRFILRRARIIVALDDLMASRLHSRDAHSAEIAVIPPWSPDAALSPVPRDSNAFRSELRVGNDFVVMYSGNHTSANPLDTLLDAAVQLNDRSDVKFVFVGDGVAKRKVEQYIRDHALTNTFSLPYQPRESLNASLSAADVHVVTLGDGFAGIIHPCKVYGAMAVARPLLYFGPSTSHLSDLISRYGIGWRVSHGDVAGAVARIRAIAAMPAEELEQIGKKARAALLRDLSPEILCGRFCDLVEEKLELANA